MFERLAFQVLHHQKIDAILAADIIEHTDVGVLQARDGLGLALETGTELLVLTEVRRKDFDRNLAVEPRVASPIHLAHTPSTQWRLDFVWAEFCARG
jgi:hypothetical protein